MEPYRSPIDMLLDPECNEDIVLYDDQGREAVFEQVALIPYNGSAYVILNPKSREFDFLEEDEAVVFEIREADGEDCLFISSEEEANAVFEIYCQLLREQGGSDE